MKRELAQLVVVGLSHHTAPVAVRERVAVPEGQVDRALSGLAQLDALAGVDVLSTSNPVEVWAEPKAPAPAPPPALKRVLAAQDPGVEAHLYAHAGGEAVRHLFRVASSLDSMQVGEPQILGQVKEAFAAAEAAGTAKGLLGRACRRAFAVAKRVRTETGIGRSAVSMSYAAVELGKKILGSLDRKTVLLLGAGKMSALAAKHFQAAGASRLVVVNRTAARAEALADEVGGEARPWESLAALLGEADVCLCSTAAPHPVVTVELVQAARRARKGRPLFFVDLAVPRDVDPRVHELEGTYVYDVDDLSQVIDENREARAQEAARAEALVAQEAGAFELAARGEAAGVLRRLRQQADELARAEVERTLQRLGPAATEAQRKEADGRRLDPATELFGADEPPPNVVVEVPSLSGPPAPAAADEAGDEPTRGRRIEH